MEVVGGMQVRVLGEGFTPEDEEDSALAEVSKVWAYQARYRVPLTKATAGTRKPISLTCPLCIMCICHCSRPTSCFLQLHRILCCQAKTQ